MRVWTLMRFKIPTIVPEWDQSIRLILTEVQTTKRINSKTIYILMVAQGIIILVEVVIQIFNRKIKVSNSNEHNSGDLSQLQPQTVPNKFTDQRRPSDRVNNDRSMFESDHNDNTHRNN